MLNCFKHYYAYIKDYIKFKKTKNYRKYDIIIISHYCFMIMAVIQDKIYCKMCLKIWHE